MIASAGCNSGEQQNASNEETYDNQMALGNEANGTAESNQMALGNELQAVPPAGAAEPTTAGAAEPLTDSQFVDKAGAGGMAEVELAKLAQKNAQSAEVKKIAKTIQQDHEKAGQKLQAIAKDKGLTVPQALPPEQQGLVDQLSGVQGQQFDQKYLATLIDEHQKDIAFFEDAAQSSQLSAELQQFAKETLPTLEKHLALAQAAQH